MNVSQNLLYLNKFQAIEVYAQKHPAFLDTGIPWSLSLSFKQHTRTIAIGSVVHGNEVGSVPAVLKIAEALLTEKIKYGGNIILFLGNVPAFERGERFIEADLNRVFGPTAPESAEQRRAFELMTLLKKADLFVDFHQTSSPSPYPFYIFGFHAPSYYWARALKSSSVLVTRPPQKSFIPGQMCSDEYARNKGTAALTLELGQNGYSPKSEVSTYETIVKAMSIMDLSVHQDLAASVQNVAMESEDLDIYNTQCSVFFADDSMQLKQGFENFSPVYEGQELGFFGDGKPFYAPSTGLLLFPIYPMRSAEGALVKPRPANLAQIITPTAQHPLLWE